MKAIIYFLILFFCVNINIIFTTCYPYETRDENYIPDKKWVNNYVFNGISKKCNWYFGADFNSNVTRGNTIVIKDPPAHILYPDSFFGFKSPAGPKFNYKRVECEFDVEAPVDHGLVVSIQQMNFDKECTDFVQLTNRDGSFNETICDKFGEVIPRSYPGSKYLGEINLKKYHKSPWEEFDTKGRIHVKISVTKKNFESLRYLFITFTAIKRDSSCDNKGSISLPRKYYCDGIKNWKIAEDENKCSTLMGNIILILILIIYVVLSILSHEISRDANKDDDYDKELPTYEALFPEKSQQNITH